MLAGGRELCDGADHFYLDRLKRLLEDPAKPFFGVHKVVDDTPAVQGPKVCPSKRCV